MTTPYEQYWAERQAARKWRDITTPPLADAALKVRVSAIEPPQPLADAIVKAAFEDGLKRDAVVKSIIATLPVEDRGS